MDTNTQSQDNKSRARRVIKIVIMVSIAVALWWVLLSPVPFDPQPQPMMRNPAGAPPFVSNNKLTPAETLPTGEGPEGVTFDSLGRLVTGLGDGRIIRVDEDGQVEEITNTNGRPLGLNYHQDGRLIIADAQNGLLAFANGQLSVLADQHEGKKLGFVDDLSIGADGRIWFSDASQLYPYGNDSLEMFAAQPTGRLFVYDPANNTLEVALDGLAFANGVAIAQDGSFVLVNETYKAQVTRYWLTGEKAGQSDVFVDNLPGFPDNITEAPNGDFWLALVAPRTEMSDRLMNSPFLRKVAWRLMQFMDAELVQNQVWAVRLTPEGEIREALDDATDHIVMMTSVLEHQGKLYLGSLIRPYVGILPL